MMEFDKSKFSRFMLQFMPVLVQQKLERDRMKGWLQNALQQYAAQEESARRLGKEKFGRDTILELIKSIEGGTEGLFKPGAAVLSRAGELGLDTTELFPGTKAISPEDYAGITAPAEKVWRDLALSFEMGMYPDEGTINQAVQLFGHEAVFSFLEEFEKKGKSLREGQFDWASLREKQERRTLDEQILQQRKVESEATGGKKGKQLTDLGKLLTGYNNQIKGIDERIWSTETDEEEAKLKARKAVLQDKIDAVLAQMEEHFPDIQKLSQLLETFRAERINAHGLDQYKAEVKKAYNLSEEEFQYLRARL